MKNNLSEKNIDYNKKNTKKAVKNTAKKKLDKPKKKNKLKKILIFVILCIIALSFVIVSGIFNITEISVEGNEKISADQVISFSGLQIGTNIFSINDNEIIENVKEDAYVENAKLKRILPNKIKIDIEERELCYIIQLSNSYIYIDSQGYILEISGIRPEVPMILGCSTDLSNIKLNDRLNDVDLEKMKVVKKIIDVAEKNNLSDLIKRIDISDKEDYIVYLDSENKIAYLGDENNLNTKFLYIKAILKEQEGKTGEIFVNVDLNDDEYVYFREN